MKGKTSQNRCKPRCVLPLFPLDSEFFPGDLWTAPRGPPWLKKEHTYQGILSCSLFIQTSYLVFSAKVKVQSWGAADGNLAYIHRRCRTAPDRVCVSTTWILNNQNIQTWMKSSSTSEDDSFYCQVIWLKSKYGVCYLYWSSGSWVVRHASFYCSTFSIYWYIYTSLALYTRLQQFKQVEGNIF